MDSVFAFFGPLVLGVILTMVLEATTGRAWGLIARKFFKRRALQRLVRFGRGDELVRRGNEALYVLQFVPGGWRPQDIVIAERPAPELETELARVPGALVALDPARLVAEIASERQRLQGFPDGEWNGASLAVDGLNALSRTREHERPVLNLSVWHSDHASAKVCGRAWMEEFDAGNIDLGSDGDRLAHIAPGMIHAIGLNATVVTDDDRLILVRRSELTSSGRNGYHISVNEGMLPEDRNAKGALDPHRGLARGMKEELGIDVESRFVHFHTAMLDVRRYQLGLLGHVNLRNTGITAAQILNARRLGTAQDKFENRTIEEIPWTYEAVVEKLAEPNWIAHGWLNLLLSAVESFAPKTDELYRMLGERTRGTMR
ncbi:hypothetical protein ACQCSX_10365 [Pseudarthrobacter sp. P1]|uniref:hypothetical protein n=1 Tax=Pseudarthrobacter sp. P1 TaxID=3418418 RepID=UPI003CE8A074